MSPVELLPCPFCGGEAHMENYIIEAVIWCKRCFAQVSRKHDALEDTGIAEAIAVWNTGTPR